MRRPVSLGLPGRSLETVGNGGPRYMIAAVGAFRCRRQQNSAYDRLLTSKPQITIRPGHGARRLSRAERRGFPCQQHPAMKRRAASGPNANRADRRPAVMPPITPASCPGGRGPRRTPSRKAWPSRSAASRDDMVRKALASSPHQRNGLSLVLLGHLCTTAVPARGPLRGRGALARARMTVTLESC